LEGLAPQVREELMDAIRRLADETGVGCVLVEQHVDIVLDFANKIVVLERGVPVFVGPTADLRARPAVLDRAIGLDKVPG
jgi:branched-chain amino acid transport system ATP-binding protein